MVTLELEKLTDLMGWRPFYAEERFTKQDEEHLEALTGAVGILKAVDFHAELSRVGA